MYCKLKIRFILICLLLFAVSAHSKSLLEKFKDLATFEIPKDFLASINDEIVGKIQAKNIKLHLPNSVEVEGVEILDEFGKRVIYSKSIRATISLLSLLTSNIRITKALIDSPHFHYTIKNEVHNIIRVFELKKPSESSSNIRITIENLSINDGRFDMFHDAGVEIHAEKVAADGSFWAESGPFAVDISKLTTAKGNILVGEIDFPLTNLLTKDLFISDQKVYTNDLSALYEKAKLFASGTVFIAEERYDLSCKLDAPKGLYPKGLKPLPFITPALKADIQMSGKLTDPQFLTSVSFLATQFNGLDINQGQAKLKINQHKVEVQSANLSVGKQGGMTANGEISIDDKTFNFSSMQKNIFVHELAKFLDFNEETKGIFSAESKFSGTFSKTPTINISSSGTISDASVTDVAFPDVSTFNFDGNLLLDKHLKITSAGLKNKAGLNVRFSGDADLIKKSTAINYQLTCPEVERYFPLHLKSKIRGLKSHGQVLLGNTLSLNAQVTALALNISGVEASDLKGSIELANNKLLANNISARINEGSVDLNLSIDQINKERLLSGNAILNTIEIDKISKALKTVNLSGKLSGMLIIGGNISKPSVQFLSSINDFVIDKVKLSEVELEGIINDKYVGIDKVISKTIYGALYGENISYYFDSKKIGGKLFVDDFDISAVFESYSDKVDGYLRGTVVVDGTIDFPVVTSSLIANKLMAYGFSLGDGSVGLSFSQQQLMSKEKDIVLSVSVNLSEKGSNRVGRFSYALGKKTINSEVTVENLELNTVDLGLKGLGMVGDISGSFIAFGPISSPVLSSNLTIKRYGFFDPASRKTTDVAKLYGPAQITAESKNGNIDVNICASLQNFTSNECTPDSGLSLKIKGPFEFSHFALNFDGTLDHKNLENVILPLKKEFISLGATATFNGKVTKQKNKEIKYVANVKIQKLESSFPSIPNIQLESPFSLNISNNEIKFVEDAHLQFFPGKLSIGGTFASSTDIHAMGEIPIVLSRLFVPSIQSADGLASGNMRIFGPSNALMVEGNITPQPGSHFTLKKWLEPIEVRSGTIVFDKTGISSFKTQLNDIKLSVGDGKVSLNGNVNKQYKNNKVNDLLMFDLDAHGSNIIIRDGLNFVETDFKIHTVQIKDKPIVEGDITITDGSAHRQFDLRNFVAETQSSSMGSSSFMENTDMFINLKIGVRQFKASASMLNLEVDANLKGQLSVEGPLSHPKFKGAVAVSEGLIKFPSTSFDLVDSQIVLDETSNKIFDPKIDIVAIEELRRSDYSVLSQDTTVKFSLRGDIDKLNVELKPISGDLSLSQLKIFMILLSPKNSDFSGQRDPFGDLKQGAKQAAMAFSGEVFLRPLTNELQELMEGATKTRVQLGSSWDPGGFTFRLNWKLGPRIELQGSYMFLNSNKKPTEVSKYEDIDLSDLKLKLLLFDHKPLGPLSLEASFGTVKRKEQLESQEPKAGILVRYRVLDL